MLSHTRVGFIISAILAGTAGTHGEVFIEPLGAPPGTRPYPYAISADATVIGGSLFVEDNGKYEPFL